VSGLISEPGVPVLTLGFLSLAGFAVYLAMLQRSTSWMRTGAKMLAVGALAVLAYQTGGPWLLVGALALSALGDAFLAHEGDAAFLAALEAFWLPIFSMRRCWCRLAQGSPRKWFRVCLLSPVSHLWPVS
jgi:uncharacterized membrane protein YhhN